MCPQKQRVVSPCLNMSMKLELWIRFQVPSWTQGQLFFIFGWGLFSGEAGV